MFDSINSIQLTLLKIKMSANNQLKHDDWESFHSKAGLCCESRLGLLMNRMASVASERTWRLYLPAWTRTRWKSSALIDLARTKSLSENSVEHGERHQNREHELEGFGRLRYSQMSESSSLGTLWEHFRNFGIYPKKPDKMSLRSQIRSWFAERTVISLDQPFRSNHEDMVIRPEYDVLWLIMTSWQSSVLFLE